MWNWLKKILIGKPECAHAWIELYVVEGEYNFGGGATKRHVLRCAKCGDMKVFRAF